MLRPPKRDRCVFCGAAPVTAEHIFPEWLQEWSGSSDWGGDPIGEHSVSLDSNRKSYDAPPFTATLRAVCATCNNGWMSRLESLVKPQLRQIILGKPREVEAFFQPALAAWVYKTTMMNELAMPEQKLWPSFYSQFYRDRLPHASSQIWLGRYDWEKANYAARYLGKRDRRRSPDTGQRLDQGPRLFKGVLTVGAAMFITCLAHDEQHDETAQNIHVDFGEYESRLQRIWPVNLTFKWPQTGLSFSPEEFEDLAVVKSDTNGEGDPALLTRN